MQARIHLWSLAAVCLSMMVSPAGAGRTVLPPGAGEPPGSVLDLGTLGGASAAAFDVNTWGLVTGESTTPDDTRHAFLTRPGQAMVALPTFGVGESVGIGINDRGDVVGIATAPDFDRHGFRQSGSTVRDLGEGGPQAVNNLREAVGWRFPQSTLVAPVAVAWTPGGVARLLGPAGKRGEALDINERGEIVGWSAPPDAVTHAVIWKPDGSVIDLGVGGGIASAATSINDLGDVAGTRYSADGTAHAVVWRRGKEMTDLMPADIESEALDLNNAGQVVGVLPRGVPGVDPSPTPFLWSAKSGLVPLTKPVVGAGRATAINDLGEIVGWVSEPVEEGRVHAMWWYEPPTLAMEFSAIRRLLAALAADHVIGRGHATALTAQVRSAERAWERGDAQRAARHTRSLGARLARVVKDRSRGIHLTALLERLAPRLEQ